MKTAMAMLVYNRPIHTGLSIAYALAHKSIDTDLHVFYSIHRDAEPPSVHLDIMLKRLSELGRIQLHYLHPERAASCGGNVDTLMATMASDVRYKCFIKIDDDILIGKGADKALAHTLMWLEAEGLMMLMGQYVPEHMDGKEFTWTADVDGNHVVEPPFGIDPVETITAVNPEMFSILKQAKHSPLCANPTGNFSKYTRRTLALKKHVGILLNPAIPIQHIGLTSSIRGGLRRSWAPAVSVGGDVLEVPYFDFEAWEDSHATGTQSIVALHALEQLYTEVGGVAIPVIAKLLVNCPGEVVELPDPDVHPVQLPEPEPEPAPKPAIIRRSPGSTVGEAKKVLRRRIKHIKVRKRARV